ncbi:ATP-binding protein [Laspinema olomoucense]|uniref:ATP-binding protein n=1 Tax=Laspinema olomoucense TaxID=3231600 RepID=UPI0021BB703F|nr:MULTISPECIES: ATP-binding protein [unclassified Laspinema]MCT7995836.1 response regulator [Laspinema sp. D3c]
MRDNKENIISIRNMTAPIGDILLVDDRPDNLRLLLNILKDKGYKVRCVTTGAMALRVCHRHPPDLILLDIQMPEMNGYQVCEKLKADPETAGIPVIFLSVIEEATEKVHAFNVGGVDYITKPFQVKEVVARVENQLQILRLQNKLKEQNIRLEKEIRDRQAIEQQLRELNREMKRSNQELEQFAYVVSHDLQAPLGTIASFAQLLQTRYQDQLDGKALQFIERIITGSLRMQHLIDDLLQYSRVGRMAQVFETVNCDQVLSQALANLETKINETQAQITQDPLPAIAGSSMGLLQLFQNLISNALKYRHPHISPRIHISVSLKEDMWSFSIQDNGIGIETKHLERIFQIFQRLHSDKEYPGTGIGLAICKKIVELYGGKIWVESCPFQGSTFYFTIPAQKPQDNPLMEEPKS